MILLDKTPAELRQIINTETHKMRMRATGLLRKWQDKERSRRPKPFDWIYGDFEKSHKRWARALRNIQRLKKFLK